jgi:hypothetical protein
VKCWLKPLMRWDSSAIWTSGEPVSDALRWNFPTVVDFSSRVSGIKSNLNQ